MKHIHYNQGTTLSLWSRDPFVNPDVPPSGVQTSQGVPGVRVRGASAGRPAAQPLSVRALRASQDGAASPAAAPVTAGLPLQLPSNSRRGPPTKVGWRSHVFPVITQTANISSYDVCMCISAIWFICMHSCVCICCCIYIKAVCIYKCARVGRGDDCLSEWGATLKALSVGWWMLLALIHFTNTPWSNSPRLHRQPLIELINTDLPLWFGWTNPLNTVRARHYIIFVFSFRDK